MTVSNVADLSGGIGRSLYTAPFIYISGDKCKIQEKNGKPVCYDKFEVEIIEIKNEEIKKIAIKNMTTNKRVFAWKKGE